MITTATKTLEIQQLHLRKGSLVIRAINHKLRQQLLYLIHQKERIRVTDLYVQLRLEQSVTSQHLAILRKAGFVNTERDGKCIYYSINYQRVRQVPELCHKLLK